MQCGAPMDKVQDSFVVEGVHVSRKGLGVEGLWRRGEELSQTLPQNPKS